jgi:hypothetical protein
MTTTKTTINLIARMNGVGAYGNSHDARLVERNGKHYLICDEWCGSDLEGKCYREFLYLVEPDQVAGVKLSIDSNEWEWLSLDKANLIELGRKAKIKWAANL